jgi:hypothetical protein
VRRSYAEGGLFGMWAIMHLDETDEMTLIHIRERSFSCQRESIFSRGGRYNLHTFRLKSGLDFVIDPNI